MNFELLFVLSSWSISYWTVVFLMSVFWGFYGIIDEANKDAEAEVITERHGQAVYYTKTKTKYIGKSSNLQKAWKKLGWMYSVGAFLSDFTWSLIGWCALYLLIYQHCNEELTNLNIFLGIVAVVGITGYGFKIPEKMKVG